MEKFTPIYENDETKETYNLSQSERGSPSNVIEEEVTNDDLEQQRHEETDGQQFDREEQPEEHFTPPSEHLPLPYLFYEHQNRMTDLDSTMATNEYFTSQTKVITERGQNDRAENESDSDSRPGDDEPRQLFSAGDENENDNEFEPLAMDEVSLDSFYAPPVPRTYEDVAEGPVDVDQVTGQSKEGFRVFWRNIIYKIDMYTAANHLMNIMFDTVPKSYRRTILRGVSGSFESGKVTALMGPSGAGKTTLLECLIGKRVKGLSGEIKVQSLARYGRIPKIEMAIIPQLDSFFEQITPREAIYYSSKLKNCNGSFHHDEIVQELIDRLELNSCSELETKRLSGSQRKRLSIACDLVSKPNFLVLDEPTTGLDAYAARSLCEMLHELAAERNLAILMTVHQPSWAIFLTFHKVYMLSPAIGRAIYEGPPEKLVNHLAAFDLHCPKSTNASDFLTEIASGKAKRQQLTDLAEHHKMQFERTNRSTNYSVNLFDELKRSEKSFPFLEHAYILTQRFCLTFSRDRFNLIVSITLSGLISALFCMSFTFSGESDGCPPDLSGVQMMNNSYYHKLLVDTAIETKEVAKNMGCVLFLVVLALMMTLTPALVLIPMELKIYWKEVKNSYYSPVTLYFAKCIFEIIFNFIFVSLFEIFIYFGTKQRYISEKNGFSGFIGFLEGLYLLSLICQAQGTVIAVFLADSPDSVIIGGAVIVMINMIFQAVFTSFDERHWFTQVVGFFVPARWMAPVSIIGLYGHERCWKYPVEENVNLIKEKVEIWVSQSMRVVDKHLHSPIIPDNFWFSQMIENHYYSNNNLSYSQYREVTKQYVNIEGEFLPIAFVRLGVNDDSDLQSHLMLLFHFILFRVLATLAIVRTTRKTM